MYQVNYFTCKVIESREQFANFAKPESTSGRGGRQVQAKCSRGSGQAMKIVATTSGGSVGRSLGLRRSIACADHLTTAHAAASKADRETLPVIAATCRVYFRCATELGHVDH